VNLNPDGPHSPERTAEAGSLFDDCSRFLVYATMAGKGGVAYPSDVYRLVADIYSATARLPQMCGQMEEFLRVQATTGRLYEARGRDVKIQCARGMAHLAQAAAAAGALTMALQAAQTDIAGLGVKEGTDG